MYFFLGFFAAPRYFITCTFGLSCDGRSGTNFFFGPTLLFGWQDSSPGERSVDDEEISSSIESSSAGL